MSAYTALCTYLVQPGREEVFRELLRRHWPTLRKYRLVTEDPALVYFGEDYSGPIFVEIMTWADPSAPGRAYWTPEVNEIWTDLYAFTESRNGRPGIDYPTVQRQHSWQTAEDAVALGEVHAPEEALPSAIFDWDDWYVTGRYLSSWDLGAGSPELACFLAVNPGRSLRTALDLGCGSGGDCILLARAGYETFGLDISQEALRLAEQRAMKEEVDLRLQCGDVLALPWEPESFDLVTDRGCFHHIPEEDRSRYASEVARVLRPGGTLLLRGSRVRQAAFIPITAESLGCHFPSVGLDLGALQETELVTTGGVIPGYMCVIRKKENDSEYQRKETRFEERAQGAL